VSKSVGRRLALGIAALVGSSFVFGCQDTSVNPPLVKTDAAPVAPDSIKKEPPTKKSENPRGSAKIGRDPSGINRNK
jgi:hypothetical protein